MEGPIGFLILILFGVVAAVFAESKGRNPVGWFFAGCFFHVLALILIAVLPDVREAQAKHRALQEENRKLRERLQHDRSVNDRRHVDIDRRLRAHDVALGIDTMPSARIDGGRAPALPEERSENVSHLSGRGRAPGPERVWYFSNDARERSAAPQNQLIGLYRDGRIGARTLVWTEGMRDWRRLAEVPELEEALRG